jgi:hypothetical protein
MTSPDEKELITTLRPQLEVASKTIHDLQVLFFETDQHNLTKQQLLMGLGMLLGLTSLGTLIYSAHKLQQPHGELTTLKTDFGHIAHELEQEAHNVNKLAENFNTISKSCQFILGRIEQQDAKPQ